MSFDSDEVHDLYGDNERAVIRPSCIFISKDTTERYSSCEAIWKNTLLATQIVEEERGNHRYQIDELIIMILKTIDLMRDGYEAALHLSNINWNMRPFLDPNKSEASD